MDPLSQGPLAPPGPPGAPGAFGPPSKVPVSARAVDLSEIFVAASSPLCIFTIFCLSVRLLSRTNVGWRLGADDWILLLAMAFTLADWAMLITPCIWYIQSKPNGNMVDFVLIMESIKLAYFGIMVWSCAMAAIKISISLTLLRFLRTTAWRAFLWGMIALQILMVVGNTIWLLLQCRPMSAAWSPFPPPGACPGPGATRVANNVTAGFNISTDVILSFMPLTFLLGLQRPLREKILLAVLMGVGLIASIASIHKTIVVSHFGQPGDDTVATGTAIVTWTCAEMFIGVIAASLPAFKMPLQRGLAKMGFSVMQPTVLSRRTQTKKTMVSLSTSTGSERQANHLGQDAHSGDQIQLLPTTGTSSPNDSSKDIVCVTTISMEHTEMAKSSKGAPVRESWDRKGLNSIV